ncbi:MAG: phytanoyl-CoA dioxygenase family protein, partial [Planctomycetes bacterium]|nr:phytanoyl-CoA dioxygenase family protein [Planctomycetota bacterium]
MDYDRKLGIERFHRNGFEVVPSVLTVPECRAMAAALDDIEHELPAGDGRRWLGSQLHLRDPIFERVLDRAPIVDMAEEMLAFDHGTVDGPPPDSSTHVINVTSITARPGDPGLRWHLDDVLLFPRPAEVPWDDRIPFPVFLVTAMYYLVDVDHDMGALMVVPGSHRSGRLPTGDAPCYEGRGPEELHVKAGDCVLLHHQLWHNSLPNRGLHARQQLQVHYAARFVAPRLYPFPNRHPPVSMLERLTP